MVKEIKVGRRHIAVVDDDWYPALSTMPWKIHRDRSLKSTERYYAYHQHRTPTGWSKNIIMHRMILDAPPGVMVDHINGDGLDNRTSNLRLCTNGQNMANRVKNKNSSSKYKGVTWIARLNKWQVQISANKVPMYLGCYENEEEAALVYNEYAIRHFGEFAKLNQVPA